MLTRTFMQAEPSERLLAYTPMIHARMFIEKAKFRDQSFQPTRLGSASPSSNLTDNSFDPYLDGNPSIDRPLFVQFCANSPDEFLEAAKHVEPYCDAVDLNLGCPQSIAKKGYYGAFLQEDWDLIYKLINNLHNHLNVPVTAKMRILETKEKTLEYAKLILSAGASIITVHGRQRSQKGHNTGLADWSVIRYLRDNLPKETVLFANGNILRYEDIGKCLQQTGADGVMSAEGNLHDPAIFAKPPAPGYEGREYWRGVDGKGGYRMDAVFRRYMDIIYQYVLEQPLPQRRPLFLPSDIELESMASVKLVTATDANGHSVKRQKVDTAVIDEENCKNMTANAQCLRKKQDKHEKHTRTTSRNLLSMQAHLFGILRPLVTKHTDIRDALARCRAGNIAAFETVLTKVENAVKDGILEYKSDPRKYEQNISSKSGDEVDLSEKSKESSIATVEACRRPWWVCQPYVRPLPKEALEKGSLTLSKKEKRQQEIAKATSTLLQTSQRERAEEDIGITRSEMPEQSMVCG